MFCVYGIDRVIINVQNGGNMNINSIVNNTLTSINLFKSKLDSSSAQIKDTANLLKINALLSNLESNLTAIKQSYNSLLADSNVSDAQISETINSLIKQAIAINNQIPSKFTADSASFSGKVTGLNQITSCCEFTTDIQKTKMLAAQQSVRVEGEVRIINIVYNSGRIENFMIIKKDIVGTGSKVYEFVPFGFSINPENVLVGGVVSAPAPNVYSFSPTNQIVYKIDTADLGKALQTRTAVLPGNLESITVNASQKESEVKPEPSVCGNKICESDEDEIGCAKDCKEKSRLPFVIIGVIVILAVLVAYFGYFFNCCLCLLNLVSLITEFICMSFRPLLLRATFILSSLRPLFNESFTKSFTKLWSFSFLNNFFESRGMNFFFLSKPPLKKYPK